MSSQPETGSLGSWMCLATSWMSRLDTTGGSTPHLDVMVNERRQRSEQSGSRRGHDAHSDQILLHRRRETSCDRDPHSRRKRRRSRSSREQKSSEHQRKGRDRKRSKSPPSSAEKRARRAPRDTGRRSPCQRGEGTGKRSSRGRERANSPSSLNRARERRRGPSSRSLDQHLATRGAQQQQIKGKKKKKKKNKGKKQNGMRNFQPINFDFEDRVAVDKATEQVEEAMQKEADAACAALHQNMVHALQLLEQN